MVAGSLFDFGAFCELERMQGKMDNINRLIDKKFGPLKPRPVVMDSWFEAYYKL